jgi:ABC-type glycerol-3-phosphate transport system permease component
MAAENVKGTTARKVATHVTLLFLAAFALAPFVWMVLASLKPLTEVESGKLLPTVWRFDNYPAVFQQVAFAKYYFNSVFIAAWTTFLVVLTSSMAGFSFARLQWPGREKLFQLYLATMMIPGLVTMIPNYTLMVKLQLLDSYQGMIIPASFSAFGTFMLRQFMMSVHPSLDEAAEMDGARPWQVYWNVIMPLCKPGLVTLAIFTFMGAYGSFFWPLIMVKSDHLRTLPIGMLYFNTDYGRQTNLLMAASVMNVIPLVVLFIAGQRFFVKGIMLGGVKG